MSIIHDALQKTQQNLRDKREQGVPKQEGLGLEWLDVLLMLIIAGLFVAIVHSYYSRLLGHVHVSKANLASASVASVEKKPLVATPLSVTKVMTTALQTPPVLPIATQPLIAPQPAAPSVAAIPAPVVMTAAPVVQPTTIAAPSLAPAPPVVADLSTVPIAVPATIPPPTATEIASQNKLMLNGVLISDQEKIALINNQPYHLGDTVEEMKIISIELHSVTLKNEARLLVLRT